MDAYAHCDIPCGIYETGTATTAAKTAAVLTRKLIELPVPEKGSAPAGVLEYENAATRMVAAKEKHAQLCKEQLLILWTDYFKPNHLTQFPELHDTFWKAAKLCSYVKQHVELSKAEELQLTVDKIAAMFKEAEAAKQ